MRVIVVDGSGPIGLWTVERLRARGYDAVLEAAGPAGNTAYAEPWSVALAGAHAVVDVSGLPSCEAGVLSEDTGLRIDEAVVARQLCRTTADLITAGASAGVRHHIALSMVGADRLSDSPFFRALHRRDRFIERSGIPYSLISTTQPYESVDDMADASTEDWVVWVPPVRARPVAGAEVASFLADVASSAPLLSAREIAGPEQIRLDSFVSAALTRPSEYRRVYADADSPYFGARLTDDCLLPGPEARIARVRYHEWLAARGDGQLPGRPLP
ncbi:SDR family oxidoreductase [Streptomyces flaveolus]|uniref:SDR family oxidoreductase n=1 Tax=Streptomyces flaveolus TaxID=67297 RepID=UPI0036F5B6AE